MSTIDDSVKEPEELAEYPEYASLNAFIEAKFADEDFEIHVWEVTALSYATKISALKIRKRLTADGFHMVRRQVISGGRRGYTAWDNNRWAGNECKGGSGQDQINGWGGQNG